MFVTFRAQRVQFVDAIGLHAVQFGNNWMKIIPRTVRGIF